MSAEKPATPEERYRGLVRQALEGIIHRAVHPEEYYAHGWQSGIRISPRLRTPDYIKKHGAPPLPPRDRIAARLTLMLVLKEMEHQLVKEAKEDTEAIADAKAHGEEVTLP